MRSLESTRVAVVGLGYVGLPLAIAFGAEFATVGYDIDEARIEELRQGRDRTREIEAEAIASARSLYLTADPEALRDSNFYVVAVPTPVDEHKRPVFSPLIRASSTVARLLKPGDVVTYESTVYPGATEELCIPVLERESGLRLNDDFFVGYSPERINPGDKHHRLPDIVKVIAASTPEAAELVDAVYRRIIPAGTHKTKNIRIAEAAKVIENTQRDVNIALMNELAIIFNKLSIDTEEVLAAARTKWNFLPFRPGLVGGHCIGVDPYYLTHKAQAIGYHPEIVLAGRRINDGMGRYVTAEVVKLMTRRRQYVSGAKVLILGFAFKENCADLRNTRVIDIVRELQSYGATVDVHDPWIEMDAAKEEYGIDVIVQPRRHEYDAIVIAVGHDAFAELGPEGIRALGKPGAVVFDVKHLLPADATDGRL